MNSVGKVIGIRSKEVSNVSCHGFKQIIGIENASPLTRETIFDVASLSKIIFTTNIFMFLYETENLNLNDSVYKYLPSWQVSDKREITIQHLLSHRSGLEAWRPLYISCRDKNEAQYKILNLPLISAVNEKRIYSDLGFIILGQVIEKIFQSGIEEIFTKQLKSKLGFHNTSYAKMDIKGNVAATSHGDHFEYEMIKNQTPFEVPEKVEDFKNWRTKILVGEVNDGNAFHVFNGVSSHAGLFSTADDLLALCQIFISSYKDGGVFQRETIRKFMAPGIDPIQGLGFRNWRIKTENGPTIVYGHTGFTGVAVGFAPEKEFAAVMLTNRLHTLDEPVKTENLWLPILEKTL